MKRYVKIRGHEHLVKDPATGAILNTDTGAIRRHEARLIAINREQQREADFHNLQREVAELKEIISKLLGANGHQ